MTTALERPGATPAVPGRSRRRLVVVAVIVVAVVGGWWLVVRSTRPDPLHLFGPHGNVARVPGVAVGRPYYLDTGLSTERAVVVDRLWPAVVTNSAHATVQVVVCVPTPGLDPTGIGGGTAADAARACRSLRPVHPGERLTLGDDASRVELVFAITPHAAGQVSVAGVHFRYHQGNRHGDEQCGTDVTIRTGT